MIDRRAAAPSRKAFGVCGLGERDALLQSRLKILLDQRRFNPTAEEVSPEELKKGLVRFRAAARSNEGADETAVRIILKILKRLGDI
jgi:hypothetical protein